MLSAIDLLPDTKTPVTLFTRHSLREDVAGQGLAGYDLQLTPQGRDLAQEWGAYLVNQTDRHIQHCISSPIQRCVDTAALMIEGQMQRIKHRIPIRLKSWNRVCWLSQAALYWIFKKQGHISKSRGIGLY